MVTRKGAREEGGDGMVNAADGVHTATPISLSTTSPIPV